MHGACIRISMDYGKSSEHYYYQDSRVHELVEQASKMLVGSCGISDGMTEGPAVRLSVRGGQCAGSRRIVRHTLYGEQPDTK